MKRRSCWYRSVLAGRKPVEWIIQLIITAGEGFFVSHDIGPLDTYRVKIWIIFLQAGIVLKAMGLVTRGVSAELQSQVLVGIPFYSVRKDM